MLVDMRSATITGKGQISIPKELRNKAAFAEGSKVAILTYHNRIEIRPLKEVSESMESAIASEQVLKKDWNTAEEDDAWKNL